MNPVVVTRFNNFSGGLTGAGKLTLGNGGATLAVVQLGVAGVTQVVNGFDVPPVFNPGTGGINLLYAPELTGRTTGPEMPPSRTLNLLSITNPNDITIAGGDVTVNGTAAGALALSGGRLITGANTLYFNSAAGTVTRTTGYVDGNFKKSVAAAASVTFESGTANGYTPVVFNITAGTFPTDVTTAVFQTPAPGIQPLSQVITRYWRLTAAGITSDITFNYLDPTDIPGTVTEANLHFLKHEAGNPSDYSDQGGTINTAANTATLTGVTSFSDWTLGIVGADLAITKTDGVTTVTPGGTVTYTITVTNGGTVGNPAAVVTDNFPAALTCSTTCVGALGGTCTAGPVAGNLNDSANVPSGGSVTYTAVCSISPQRLGLAGQHRDGLRRRHHRLQCRQQLGDRHRRDRGDGGPRDHQDRRRDHRDGRRLGDLHHHRQQRRAERGPGRHGGGHLPGRADLHHDLHRGRRRHLHGVRLGEHQRHRQPARRRQRHLHGELHHLGRRHRPPAP